MPYYRKLGEVPPKRHIQFKRDPADSFNGEGLAYEHVVTTMGFDRAYSILYHLRPPTRVSNVEVAGSMELKAQEGLPLRHHHLRSNQMVRSGDPITGRVPLLFNEDVTCYRCRPDKEQSVLYRNGTADEMIYVFSGKGWMESSYGRLPYREGDYVVVPRGTIYSLKPDDVQHEDYLVLESPGVVRIPERYLNPDGQLMLGAPYYERDFHGPTELLCLDLEEETEVLVKDGTRLTRYLHPHHPFDVLGWDGLVYPFTFNVEDFEPLTGTVHLPPPYQQTFEVKGFVVCTFAPRHLDHHPEAVKVPYVHDNLEADEVLFYVRGNFGSRKGIEQGSLTLHPCSVPHGPHPGTILASMGAQRTEELAVMFDTEKPLRVTPQAMKLDDPNYPYSWL